MNQRRKSKTVDYNEDLLRTINKMQEDLSAGTFENF